MLKMCCYHYYLHLTEEWNSIPLEISNLHGTLSYKNIVSLFYKEKIILLNKTFSNQNCKKNALSHFNISLKFKNIFVIDLLPLEKRYNKLKEEYQIVSKLIDDLETERDDLETERDELFDKLSKSKKLKNKLNKKNNQIINLSKKLETVNKEINKKDKLNKRLVNVLTIYKYHEFNNVEKYDYNEIKQKNKALNTEFKRVAKLMKLNM
jgi:DNA repair exonuclease SbcCD ATPase subunit